MSIIDQVRTSLIHYSYWTNVVTIDCGTDITILSGAPPEPIHPVAALPELSTLPAVPVLAVLKFPAGVEFVYPVRVTTQLTMQYISSIFAALEREIAVRPRRIVLGILAEDGTIVYYFVHDGITKPKKN